MSKVTRRDFLAGALAGATSLAASKAGVAASLWATPVSATERVQLAATGVEVSRIAMGTGFRGWQRASNQTRLGQEAFTRLMRHGLDSGLNFVDAADLYGSHTFVRNALSGIPRDQFVLLSKVWFTDEGGMQATDRAIPSVERFRRELDTEMIDICLIHCVTNSEWPSQLERMRDELSELKQKGVVRAVGCSCHDLGALEVAAQHPWVDVIFARINPGAKVMDHSDPDVVATVLERARANGKAVVGMKIFGAGQLTEPLQREQSLRYVWGRELVDAMTIGFEKTEQMDDTAAMLNRVLK